MGSIIKNQILKHLSKFTKNLSPDKINISTLKGEGELTNLELNENVLMELMELPTWMKLTKAVCNKVSCKVQWTKLKSQPICLFLDEVVLEVETCSEPRPPNKPGQQSNTRSEGRYGFVDKVMDGIYVHINSVSVQFSSDKFHASLQLSRVKVQSMTPCWTLPTDMRQSRIRSEPTDEIILFKEVDWSTTRIEANAHEGDTSLPTTPLRLIANQSKVRIVMKKKLSDCSVIATRIIFLLDDLLWVLTDTQLKSAMVYVNSLSTMIEKSSQQSKQLAAEKLQKQVKSGADQLYMQQQLQSRPRSQTNEAKYFQKYDVQTTSYHLITSRVDLHLCDDTPMEKDSSPKHNKKINGGAMQITIYKLSLDYYPFHYAGGERKSWYRYTDNQGSRNTWVQDLFKAFRAEASRAREVCKVLSPTQSPAHQTANQKSPAKSPPQTQNPQGVKNQGQGGPKVTKLLESCMVMKIEEFIIYRVSTADNKRNMPQKFFSSDKKALHLPSDMSVIHVEYTDYFFTDGIDYPVPHANMYVLVNPVRLHLDYLTMLWSNYFSLNLAQVLETPENEIQKKLEHVDIKVEALMPRVVVSAEEKVEKQPDRPDSLQIQFSKITASNTHIENQFTFEDLQGLLSQYKNCDMFTCTDFPNDSGNLTSIPKIFQAFADSRVNPYLCGYILELLQGKLPNGFSEKDLGTDAVKTLLRTDTLKRDMRCDMWVFSIDQVWLEFLGVPTSRTRPVPFVESFPLTLWVCHPTAIPDDIILPDNCSATVNGDCTENGEKGRRKTRQLLKQYYSEDNDDNSLDSKDSSTQDNNLKDSNNCDIDDGSVQYSAFKVADFNLAAKIGGKIRAQLNNPQYLFLMRVIESFSNFQLQLNADVEDFFKGSDTPAKTFAIPLCIPELEFAMVCPYIAELLPLSNPDILCSPNSESMEEREVDVDTDSDIVGVTDGTSGMEDIEQADQTLTVTETNGGTCIEMSENLLVEGHLSHSQSDSTIVRYTQNTDELHLNQGVRLDSHSSEDITQSEIPSLHVSSHNIQYTASDSGISSLGTSSISSGQRSRSGSKLTPTTMKKSFTTGVTNISNFMGKIKNRLDPDDLDDCDNISIRTDTSDDDDFEFLGLDDNEAPAFNHSHMSETSSTADTDDLSSVFAESTSASRAKEVVSAVVFRLSGIELLIQSIGEDMFISLQTKAIDCEETGNTPYEDFYAKLSSQNGVVRNAALFKIGTYPIKFKMTKGPCAEHLAPKGSELGVMEIRVKDYEFTFRMTSILNMTSFIEDEKVAIPTPMHIIVDNFKLTLLEDRPPPIASHAAASAEPVNLNIHHMFIQRHDDGVFHMTTDSKQRLQDTGSDMSKSETAKQHADANLADNKLDFSNLPADIEKNVYKLISQNEQLKILCEKLDNHSQKQDTELEKLKKENERLVDLEDENKKLREKLKSFAMSSGPSLDEMEDLRKVNADLESENATMMERVVTLQEELDDAKREKESLLSTLQLMQEELIASEQYRQRNNSTNSQK
ncbi:bridge-like lipid transfer protein family member 3B isoform X2 [Ruditapes philippinarum]|uniref:bridge-like lipid transfer protein family member 3B isoform X2 n=1 Tax=Ruditapes philippinarum TaxID=129788 RepID=UPI00295C11D9|nr:bridge-like lipid transfer protein family member 3B isoform X2 [Ruditapes philippinarum]